MNASLHRLSANDEFFGYQNIVKRYDGNIYEKDNGDIVFRFSTPNMYRKAEFETKRKDTPADTLKEFVGSFTPDWKGLKNSKNPVEDSEYLNEILYMLFGDLKESEGYISYSYCNC